MYIRRFWQDHVTQFVNRFIQTPAPEGTVEMTPVEGTVHQPGTPQNADNFNAIETGIFASSMQADQLTLMSLQLQRGVRDSIGESGTITLANSQQFPFNNSNATVALVMLRDLTDYTVTLEAQSAAGGGVGDLRIANKLRNGFQLAFTGGASSVTVRYNVTGGMV